MLSALRFDNSDALMQTLGTVLGLGLAILFGVSFVRGTIRIDLRSFFRMTTVILMVVVLQLTITGLHELSEAQILPGSAREMALVDSDGAADSGSNHEPGTLTCDARASVEFVRPGRWIRRHSG